MNTKLETPKLVPMSPSRPLELMANAGAEYMVKRKPKGSNPVPRDNLSWVPLTDFVAICFAAMRR